ncbi:MAG: SIS domain-containing protein [Clostridia bacterium]
MKLTQKELCQQYSALAQTNQLIKDSKQTLNAFFKEKAPRAILFTGCGSSFLLSCSFRSIAASRTTLPVYAVAAGDLWINVQQYRSMLENTLIISVSRSGQTSELVKAYEAVKAMDVHASFLSIVCSKNTPVYHLSDYCLEMPWAFDESVCQTRCVSNLYAAGAMVIGTLTQDGSIAQGMQTVAQIGDDFLRRCEPTIKEIAKQPWNKVVVLADGEVDGLAEEASLAFNEISQLPSNYYHILDVRHGPMVLINHQTLVFIALKSPLCAYEHALVQDVLARGANVIGYSQEALPSIDGATMIALGEDVGSVAGGMGLVLLCQLMSCYKSVEVGCNPDTPDGLCPWVEIK